MICASMFTLLNKTKDVGKRIFYIHVHVYSMMGNLRQWVKAASRGRVLEPLEKLPCENIISLTLRMVIKSR